MLRPITKMETTAGTTTNLDLIYKLNEIIDRLNYITDEPTVDPFIRETVAGFEREVVKSMPPKRGMRRK